MSYTKPAFEVADIARKYGPALIDAHKLTSLQKKVMTAICNCRTLELGGHKEVCNNDNCAHERFAYNGCRDRHCPKCNALKREKWVMDRKADALPVPYFHIVFTIPHSLETLCLSHGKEMYNLLFRSSWETIQCFARDHKHLGAETGMVSILHTWGQNLERHTHVHCLVPAGGMTPKGAWRAAKSNGKFFVHVKKLSAVFRGKFTDGLVELQNQKVIGLDQELIPTLKYLHPLFKKQWVVYAKKPFPSSDKVVEYIGRYSHRVAISNHRIKNVENGKVTFSWIDYRTEKIGMLSLDASDFLLRFFLHVLPSGFVKIRHYGILSSRNKSACIEKIRSHFAVPSFDKPAKDKSWIDVFVQIYGRHPKLCPCCGKGMMMAMDIFTPKHLLRTRDGPPLEPNFTFCSQKQ